MKAKDYVNISLKNYFLCVVFSIVEILYIDEICLLFIQLFEKEKRISVHTSQDIFAPLLEFFLPYPSTSSFVCLHLR